MNCRFVRIKCVAERLKKFIFVSVCGVFKQKFKAGICSSPSSDRKEKQEVLMCKIEWVNNVCIKY